MSELKIDDKKIRVLVESLLNVLEAEVQEELDEVYYSSLFSISSFEYVDNDPLKLSIEYEVLGFKKYTSVISLYESIYFIRDKITKIVLDDLEERKEED